MRVLACETSGAACSVAWHDTAARAPNGGREFYQPMTRGHAEHLPQQLADLLGRAGDANTPDIPDRLAVGIGPGSFTGVRIGLAAMRALALAWQRPLCGVGSMAAMAARLVRTRARPRAPFLVLLETGRTHCYAQAFAPDGAPLNAPARLDKAGAARLAARHRARSALGDGAARFAAQLPCHGAPPSHAGDVARLAAAAAACRAPVEPLYLQPYHVRAKLPPLAMRARA